MSKRDRERERGNYVELRITTYVLAYDHIIIVTHNFTHAEDNYIAQIK